MGKIIRTVRQTSTRSRFQLGDGVIQRLIEAQGRSAALGYSARIGGGEEAAELTGIQTVSHGEGQLGDPATVRHIQKDVPGP
jgi:hypothetical protein